MACTSDKLLDNIRWRMESLTAHSNTDSTIKNFVYYDKAKIDGELTPGMTRGFYLYVPGGTSEEPENGVMTEATQASRMSVMVRIAYYKQGDWHALQKLMQADAFDVKKLLRNPSNWDGTDSDPSVRINADYRFPTRWTFEETPYAVYLNMALDCYITEDE